MKKMKISVTEAARNFADCVNRVHYQRMTFILLRNGEAVAQLVPEEEKVCTAKEWAKLLRENPLSDEEARLWQGDLKRARKMLKPPVNKWR
jgi:antitoxin (DNA-binding transcriptional repressor) of toxin-antitoxin stability system